MHDVLDLVWYFSTSIVFLVMDFFDCLSNGTFYFFIANFFATQNIGGAKELVVLL